MRFRARVSLRFRARAGGWRLEPGGWKLLVVSCLKPLFLTLIRLGSIKLYLKHSYAKYDSLVVGLLD